MNEKELILTALDDPDVITDSVRESVSRREAVRSGGAWSLGMAIASVPAALAVMARSAAAQEALPDTIVNTLNFALLLEYLEADFYNQGLAAPGLIPFEDRAIFQQIAKHENAHVIFLRAVLGSNATPEPKFDFTAGGAFDAFGDYATFALLAQAFEDTGVRAYKGQAANLVGSDLVLSAALRIHSVEARHASEVRRLRGLKGWIPLDQMDAPGPVQPVYAGEDNTVHAGIDATTVTDESTQAVTEAFDEPLGIREVLAIASGFGTNMLKNTTAFDVTVENVSQPGTVDTERAMGTVPLSPGAFAVFAGMDPVFTPGQMADAGTELIAEDGFPGTKANALAAISNVSQSGIFASPGGPDSGPAIFAGESASFVVNGGPGDRLQFETMFVQSNDWFYGFGNGGLQLFDGDSPVSGDVTSQLVLYDAGTEEDTAPGTGEFQKPVQDPMATDVGPAESEPIATAAERHPDFTIPDTTSVIRVTITPR